MSEEHYMKTLEKAYRTYLPKKSFAVIRVDGKGFSKYTKDLNKPFDSDFTAHMRETAQYLAENIDGAVCAYTQSDEISVIFSDLGGTNTEWWFGGQVQKLVSISAALATAKFNALRPWPLGKDTFPIFDARVHHLNGEEGVLEYLKWRQTDAVKNSVGMLASHHFSHKSLMGESTRERIIRLGLEKGVYWHELSDRFRFGSLVRKETRAGSTNYWHNSVRKFIEFERNVWVVEDAPVFEDVDQLGTGMRKALLRGE